jgi:hypothetical protein
MTEYKEIDNSNLSFITKIKRIIGLNDENQNFYNITKNEILQNLSVENILIKI